MAPKIDKGKQKAVPPEEELNLELLPKPLFSPQVQASRSLPHLVDVGTDVEKLSVWKHQHDGVFWNSVLEDRGDENASPSPSQLSNWDLYKPPTPPLRWPKRADSTRATHFEPVVSQRDAVHEEPGIVTGQEKRPHDPHGFRGGGPFTSLNVNLPPHALDTITAFVQTDPLRDHDRKVEYVPQPTTAGLSLIHI